jgi:hypothetical protein
MLTERHPSCPIAGQMQTYDLQNKRIKGSSHLDRLMRDDRSALPTLNRAAFHFSRHNIALENVFSKRLTLIWSTVGSKNPFFGVVSCR